VSFAFKPFRSAEAGVWGISLQSFFPKEGKRSEPALSLKQAKWKES